MPLDDRQLDELQELACLRLDAADRELLRNKLEQILDYFEQLAAVDTEGVGPTSHVMERDNVFREDRPKPGLEPGRAVGLSPRSRQGYFEVPPVLDGEREGGA